MRTSANIAGHPIHPMLVTIPIGLWLFSFVCDLIFHFVSNAPEWNTVALYTMGGGIVGALMAAVPGLIDLVSLPAEPRKTALWHMAINLTIVVIYIVNFWLRLGTPAATGLVWLSLLTVLMLAVSGWLGGKMVFLLRVGVSTGEEKQQLDPSRVKMHHTPGEQF